MISDVETMLSDSNSLYENVRSYLELWQKKLFNKKQFKDEWHEFMAQSRKLIQKTMQVEENFFPKTTGNFGDSIEIAQSYQKSLDEFMPTVKRITTEIEDYITRAEILSLNGDTQGQKELIINELTKLKQRFLARVNEYRILLQMAIRFFHNYHKVTSILNVEFLFFFFFILRVKLEEIIDESHSKYKRTELPEDLITAENVLKQHINEKDNVMKLISFTSSEGDEIVFRVRQQVNNSSQVLSFVSCFFFSLI
jgi:hypothetical protein